MTIEEALTYHAANNAGVAALVAARIYPNVIPQDATLPALAYQRISGPREMAHDGPVGVASPRFQWTGQADLYSEVVALMNAVRVAFDGYSGTMGGVGGVTVEGVFVKNEFDGHQFETERETRRLDMIVWHQE